jgi:16S rRNA (cytosine967-C5)-methyltransferase
MTKIMSDPRYIAFTILQDIYRNQSYSDLALDRGLRKTELSRVDRGLVSELVYGVVRRQRSLDTIIDQLGKKKAYQQPPDLRIILHLGLYQLRYLNQIPPSAAVNTSVDLAKSQKLKPLAGVVNGLLRKYIRLANNDTDPLKLPEETKRRLGILHSFPDWMIQLWIEQWGEVETEKLCHWFNQTPNLDLRVNILKTDLNQIQSILNEKGIEVTSIPFLPQALRVKNATGLIKQLPGFQEGWWTIQDSSAQLVSHLLDPQPHEFIIDGCAAPGGKTTHIAELIGDQGTIWGCDRLPSRLKKLQENIQRLELKSITICPGDLRQFSQFREVADRVLLDVPCSGLGTLHKRPDLRWRQTPEKIEELSQLQQQLLAQGATWVKPNGVLVYATCTLHPLENEMVIQSFLKSHPNWQIIPPSVDSPISNFVTPEGWLKVLPHRHQMDGFFIVKLQRGMA